MCRLCFFGKDTKIEYQYCIRNFVAKYTNRIGMAIERFDLVGPAWRRIRALRRTRVLSGREVVEVRRIIRVVGAGRSTRPPLNFPCQLPG